MVVEDDHSIREFLTAALEVYGYKVAAARDGQEALDLLREIVPDLVLTDLEMPRVDGWELIANLRFDPVASHVPVVVLSAKATPSLVNELGVRAVLVKPFRMNVLLDVMQKLIP